MLNKKLFATCLLVDDFEKSLSFYKEVLGLEINTHEGKFADFKLGETGLALFEKEDATSMFPKKYMKVGGSAVIAFTTKNLKKFCSMLNKQNINIIEGPKETPWGQKVAYILDPDENVIEISEC